MIKNKKAALFIGAGITLFALKYIPVYHVNDGWFNIWYSLDSAAALCNSFLGAFAKECSWISPLNTAVIIISITLVAYGVYNLIKKKHHFL